MKSPKPETYVRVLGKAGVPIVKVLTVDEDHEMVKIVYASGEREFVPFSLLLEVA